MILSDSSIKYNLNNGWLYVHPYDESLVQPASLDVRLGEDFLIPWKDSGPQMSVTDLAKDNTDSWYAVNTKKGSSIVLYPGEFILGATLEYVHIPADLVARVEGKSSLGRVGLLVHATAGFIDPGFAGTITLELFNLSARPIVLYPHMPVAQLSFMQMTTPAVKPYGASGDNSKYQNQTYPTPSQFHKNFPLK